MTEQSVPVRKIFPVSILNLPWMVFISLLHLYFYELFCCQSLILSISKDRKAVGISVNQDRAVQYLSLAEDNTEEYEVFLQCLYACRNLHVMADSFLSFL